MRLLYGWNPEGKFVLLVDDGPGTPVLHRVSLTPEEVEKVRKVMDTPDDTATYGWLKHAQER